MSNPGIESDFELSDQVREETEEPPKFRVILINDDYTTFDFVVQVLVTIFKRTVDEAIRITTDVHNKGNGVCGVYTKQIAETKVDMVHQASQTAGFPLKCTMEEV